jgi:hypothetical protein
MKNMGLDQRFGWMRFVRIDDLIAFDWICHSADINPDESAPQEKEIWCAIQTELERRNDTET